MLHLLICLSLIWWCGNCVSLFHHGEYLFRKQEKAEEKADDLGYKVWLAKIYTGYCKHVRQYILSWGMNLFFIIGLYFPGILASPHKQEACCLKGRWQPCAILIHINKTMAVWIVHTSIKFCRTINVIYRWLAACSVIRNFH